MTEFVRRDFLRKLAKAGIWAASAPYVLRLGTSRAAASVSDAGLRFDSERAFPLSIASGDPTSSGVMLWTRLSPEVVIAGAPLYVQVALDRSFSQLVLEAEVSAAVLSPLSDYTVRVDLEGQLDAGSVYYYRFVYGGTASRTGRCRTLPEGSPRELTFAVLSCQDYTNGYYGALRCVADDDVDFVLHLGDFVYESAADPRFQALPFVDREVVLPSGERVAFDLADYRHLYRTYRGDPDLQRMLEQHTLIVIHDDHETANDCYWDYELDTLGAPDHPLRHDAGAMRALKLASQRAWLEYVPVRVVSDDTATHPHDYFKSYRGFDFGDLVSLSMLDTRTYRTPHPCGEGDVFERYMPIGCRGKFRAPAQSVMGDEQAGWLIERMSASRATWNVLGNQTYFGALSIAGAVPINVDGWDGYEAERRWLTGQIAERGIENLVVLTGDLHSYIASQIKQDYRNLNVFDRRNQVGVEFMTPAVTSAGLLEMLGAELSGDPTLTDNLTEAAVRLNNPHIRYFNNSRHGYSTIRFTRDYCEWIAYAVDKNVVGELASRRAVARFQKHVSWPFLLERSV